MPRGRGLRGRVPPGRPQGRAPLGRAAPHHRHREYPRDADDPEGGGRRRASAASCTRSSSSVYGGATEVPTPETAPAHAPLAVRGDEARRRALLPRLRGVVRARDGRAALLQRLRARGNAPTRPTPRSSRSSSTRSCTATSAGRPRRRAPVARLHVHHRRRGREPRRRRRTRGESAPATCTTSPPDRRRRCSTCCASSASCSASTPQPQFVEPRAGDVRLSQADARAAARDLGFRCKVDLREGLTRTVEWLRALA